MALILTYREHQLLKAFRACDARGRYMVEDMAAQQAAASRPQCDKKEGVSKNTPSDKPRHLARIK